MPEKYLKLYKVKPSYFQENALQLQMMNATVEE